MKVLQVVPSIAAESSGPSYSVPAFCSGLQKAGCDTSLHVLEPVPNRSFDFCVVGYKCQPFPCSRLGRSSAMLKGLRRECKTADVIHNSSLWMFPNVYCDWARRETSCKLVMQPRGTLSKWALSNSKWAKRVFGYLFQYAALRHTDMWVATAESEFEEIRALGYRQPVCILPNGIDLPEERLISSFKDSMPKRRRMYFLSRIHPKKNVDLLLRAWARLEDRFSEWDLSIVGPDKGNSYADEMKNLAGTLGCRRVTFEGELKGEAKLKFVAQSECIVLPTHSENFGMVIAEALSCGTSAICSYGAPWEGLNTEKCGWWVPTTVDDFELAMSAAMSMSREDLLAMGKRGRKWMQRDFSWESIGVKMKAAYEWLLDPGHVEKPEWVREGGEGEKVRRVGR